MNVNARSVLTLVDLNQFTILASETVAEQTRLRGRLSKPGQPTPGDAMRLFISLEDDVPGQLTEVDPDARTAVFDASTEHLHPALVVGSTFPIYNSYWFGRIDLVLDAGIQWRRKQFVAPDAFVQDAPTPGWRQSRAAELGDESRADGQIVPGGWDHEHCEICWRHIGSGGDPEGYVTGNDEWVCTSCYSRYVERHDLSFVPDGAEEEVFASAAEQAFAEASRLIDDYNLDGIRSFVRTRGCGEVRNRHGWTPLMTAAKRGHRSLVKLLLNEGCDVNALAEANGYTALALAAQAGHAEIVQMLLNAGADVRVQKTFCGGSMLQFVKTGRGHSDTRIIDLLTRAGAT
jgi:hypothetical protein